MNKSISHRGPDYTGTYSDNNIVLGHRLLAIREDADLSHQPYVKSGSPWVLLFNGQIYNTEQLKHTLAKEYKGSDLDTEVLYGVIEKYGWDFIAHVHGMFAIALYNREEKIIRLYRDPSGQKLLYYYEKGGQFAFSSEIRGILSVSGVDKILDHEALTIATALGFVPGTKTLFAHISKTDVSEIVTYNIKKRSLSKNFFISKSQNYYPKLFEDALDMLVREHLQSKQKIALNLSGGLDSSLLLHSMSKVGHTVHSYTTKFDVEVEKFNRDAEFAKRLAKDYGTYHTEICITKKDYLENYLDSYKTIEEPRQNISIPIYYITAKREGIHGDKNRVILSGDGGDEIFGGYQYYARNVRDDALMRIFTPVIFNLVRNFRNKTPDLDFQDPRDRWYFYKYFKYAKESYLSGCPPLSVVPPYIRASSEDFLSAYKIKSGSVYGTMLVDRAIWLAGENFIRSDKIYMSQSLEMRNPLSYHPFRMYVDTMLSESDYISGKTNKNFLRSWARGKLPDYVLDREDKTGWRAPANIWYGKDTKELFMNIVSSAKKRSSGLVDWKRVQREIETSDTWPKRQVRLLVSLAVLAENLGIEI